MSSGPFFASYVSAPRDILLRALAEAFSGSHIEPEPDGEPSPCPHETHQAQVSQDARSVGRDQTA